MADRTEPIAALIHTDTVTRTLDALQELPPGTRAQTGRWLMIQLEAVEREAVAEMRANGASWADVGQAIGTTRQNAQQLFGR